MDDRLTHPALLVLRECQGASSGCGLRSTATTCDLTATQLFCLGIGHIQLAYALASICVRNAERCTLAFWNLGT